MTDMVQQDEAQELTPEEFEARVAECHGIEERIKAAMQAGKQAMWDLAKASYEFKETQGWTALGYEKLGDWLADPEISMKRATFYRLHQSYYDTVVMREIPEEVMRQVDQSKLAVVLPKVKASKVSIEEALEDAKNMGMQDLRDVYVMRPQTPPRKATEPKPQDDEPETIEGSATPIPASETYEPDGYREEPQEAPQEGREPLPPRAYMIDWDALEVAIEYANAALNIPLRNKHRQFDKEAVEKMQTAVEQLVDAVSEKS